MEIAEGRRLVDEDVAGQVDRQVDPRAGEGANGACNAGILGVVKRGGDGALGGGKLGRAGDAFVRIRAGDDEGHGSEAFVLRDGGIGIAVNAAGEVALTANTGSANFPLVNPLLSTRPGERVNRPNYA